MSRARAPKRKVKSDDEDADKDEVVPYTGPDRLSRTANAVLQRHIAPFLVQTRQQIVMAPAPIVNVAAAAAASAFSAVRPRHDRLRPVSRIAYPDGSLGLLNRTLSAIIVPHNELQARTKQFSHLLAWMTRWCDVRRDLLIDVGETAHKYHRKPDGHIDFAPEPISSKIIGVEVLREAARLPALGLPTLILPIGQGFLEDPVQIEARDVAWRAFLIGKTPQEYDAALGRFRTTMQALQARNIGSKTGWSGENTLANEAKMLGNQVSALEAVLQLVLGRNLVNGEEYFTCMMWVLLEEFGAHAAWIVATLLVWMGHYTGVMAYTTSSPSLFAHVARVMLDKDPHKLEDVKAAEQELNRMLHPYELETTPVFSSYSHDIWPAICHVWEARGRDVEELP
jgi:hypothetical protein